MPGRLTVWGASQLLTTYFSRTTTPPPIFYLALIREIAPNPYLSGSELDEPDTDDYARVAIDNTLANWSNSSSPQEIANTSSVQFVTATTDWGMIRYWALCNSVVDGYNFLVGDLETPISVAAGDQPVFSPSDLSMALGPFYLYQGE
jgi:hypothetical protein